MTNIYCITLLEIFDDFNTTFLLNMETRFICVLLQFKGFVFHFRGAFFSRIKPCYHLLKLNEISAIMKMSIFLAFDMRKINNIHIILKLLVDLIQAHFRHLVCQ